MHRTADYGSWVLQRDEILSEAAKIRLGRQARRHGRSARNPLRLFRLFAATKFFTAGDLRRQTP